MEYFPTLPNSGRHFSVLHESLISLREILSHRSSSEYIAGYSSRLGQRGEIEGCGKFALAGSVTGRHVHCFIEDR